MEAVISACAWRLLWPAPPDGYGSAGGGACSCLRASVDDKRSRGYLQRFELLFWIRDRTQRCRARVGRSDGSQIVMIGRRLDHAAGQQDVLTMSRCRSYKQA